MSQIQDPVGYAEFVARLSDRKYRLIPENIPRAMNCIWDPRYFAKDNEVPIDSVILLAELQGQPYFSRVLEEVRERRGSEEE